MAAEPLDLSLRDSTAEDALYDPTGDKLDGLTDEEKYLSSNATALAEAEERGVLRPSLQRCIGGDRSYKHAQGERTCRSVNPGMNWKSIAFSISN
ncbi:hypothetical protein SUNI508_08430 [Seiridium unicorne]|uniref:Uncharacterized protein n=1 Tax=Seiridium unicorne TaxID=138068 RepID=A0ABR2UUN4_9PEZI